MGFLIVCPACLQHLNIENLDPVQVAALDGALCTCAKCNTAIVRDEHGRVVAASTGGQTKVYGFPDSGTGVVVRRDRGDRSLFRLRGFFHWLFGKRVTVTNEHVEVTLRWRKIHHVIPLAHALGVSVIQHVFLDTMHSMWGTYFLFEGGMIPLAGFSKLERAIDHASAINRVVFARRPSGDPYRGLLVAGEGAA